MLAAVLALLLWACPVVLAKAIPIEAIPLVFYRCWLGLLLALGALRLAGGRLTLETLRVSLWAGVALGLDLIFFFTAIKLTTVANATAIGALQPVLLIFAAPVLFGERLRWPDVSAALVAVGGVLLVTLGSQAVASWSLRGDVFALLTLFAWTAYFITSKRARRSLGATELSAGVALVSAVVVTPFALIAGGPLPWPEPGQWIALMVIATFGWCGHVLMTWALAYIPLWVGGTVSLAIPVVASGLALVFLGERFLPIQLLGMVIVLMSLTVVSARSPQVLGDEPASSRAKAGVRASL